ncbi:putative glycosyltransferase [Sesbania bispinosa]|nr:putative glycosyltransferase [Sesbania bispinosa]
MGSGRNSYCGAWRGSSESSSSMKLLLFMMPLIVVAGLISLMGPNYPYTSWVLIPNPPILWSSGTPSASNNGAASVATMEASTVSSDMKQKEGLVVMAVDLHGKEEKAIISDDSAFNHSSTPPLSIQAIQTPQQFVRA